MIDEELKSQSQCVRLLKINTGANAGDDTPLSDFKECWVELGRVMAQNAEDMTSPTCMVLVGK